MVTFLLQTNISASAEGLLLMTRPKVVSIPFFSCTSVLSARYLVDENLFYKGVDKTKVHGARLHQSHLVSDPADPDSSVKGVPSADDAGAVMENQHPPYPFDSGNSLLALTRKHNVGFTALRDIILFYYQYFLQMTIAQIVHDNEVCPSSLVSKALLLDYSNRSTLDTLMTTSITK